MKKIGISHSLQPANGFFLSDVWQPTRQTSALNRSEMRVMFMMRSVLRSSLTRGMHGDRFGERAQKETADFDFPFHNFH
jgi:hypothetical protein